MKCSCEKWKESYPKVEAITMYAHVHGMNYEGDEFQFCPWCGSEGVITTHEARPETCPACKGKTCFTPFGDQIKCAECNEQV